MCALVGTFMCTGGYLYVHWWVLVCALVGTCMCTGGYLYVHWWVLVCALVGTCMCTVWNWQLETLSFFSFQIIFLTLLKYGMGVIPWDHCC